MAVPASGNQITMVGIYSEKNEDDYSSMNPDSATDISLRGLSDNDFDDSSEISSGDQNTNKGNLPANRPDGNTPHAMSEFYSYDHDATEPSFFDALPDFTITATSGAGVAAVYSSTYMIRLLNALGDFHGAITSAPAYGTLSIAIGSSDPGTSGTGGGASGWTAATGITGAISVSGSARVYIKFKWEVGLAAGQTGCNVRLSINPISATSQGLGTGVVDNATVTAKAT